MNACIELGVDMLEIDVRKTKDGHLVVIHDETVDRTTNGSGLVAELTLEEIRTLKLREGAGGPDAKVTEHSIPLLEEVLEELDGRVLINLDAKEAIREMAVAVAQVEGVEDQVVIKAVVGSPQAPVLVNASYLKSVSFMPIIRPKNGDPAHQITSFEGEAVEAFEIIFESEEQLAASCDAAEKLGARCWVNTMWESLSPGHSDERAISYPERHWGRLMDLGVDMIQTDRPRELIAFLESRNTSVSKD